MEIVYVNGVGTSRAEAENQAAILADITDRHCELCYNKAFTPMVDLLESLYNRWLFWAIPLPVTNNVVHRIRQTLERVYANERSGRAPSPVHVVGHSQGTAIVMNAMRMLTPEERMRCNVSLFASVATQEPSFVNVEYFRNRSDYVVQSLPGTWLMRLARRITGRKRQRQAKTHVRVGATGHAFVNAYLRHLVEFNGYRSSKFHNIVDREKYAIWLSGLE